MLEVKTKTLWNVGVSLLATPKYKQYIISSWWVAIYISWMRSRLCYHREMQKEELFCFWTWRLVCTRGEKLAEKLQYLKWARKILNPSTKCQNWWKAKTKALEKCIGSILRGHLRIHLFTKKHWTNKTCLLLILYLFEKDIWPTSKNCLIDTFVQRSN